jgi:hypothetical protein
MKILGCTISLVFMIALGELSAQDPVRPKRERDWNPSAVYLSGDLASPFRSAFSQTNTYEFRTKVDFDSYFLVFDYGRVNSTISRVIDPTGADFDYKSEGNFFRIGPQVDFMPFNKNWSNLTFGIMYAWANFNDRIDYELRNEEWDDVNLNYSNNSIRARWYEASLGLSAHIIGPLYLGYTFRFKLAKKMSDPGPLKPYEIPGFGPARRGSNFGMSYYITYRLGFRKKAVPVKPKAEKVVGKSQRTEDNPNPTP